MFRRRGSNVTLAGQLLPMSTSGSQTGSGMRRTGGLRHQAGRHLRLKQQQQQQAVEVQHADQQRQPGLHHYAAMSDACFMLARKFAVDAVPVRT